MASTAPTQRTAPLKGSWEETYTRAQRMAGNRNDEAIPLYEKLVTRLSKMPKDQLLQNDERLRKLLMSATAGAQSYLNLRERYDDALRIMDLARPHIDDDEELESYDLHRADILMMAGQLDKAFELLREKAQESEEQIDYLGTMFRRHLQYKQWVQAESVLNELETQAAIEIAAEEDPLEAARVRGYVDSCHALLALEKGEWENAITWYEKMAENGSGFSQNYQFLYIPLVHGGQYETALPFIQRDKARKVRSGFWEGLAQYRLGNPSAAERAWKRVVSTALTEEEARFLFEFVLAHFYLGDKEREGLELVLRVIREVESPNWSLFALAGLGWAARGTMSNAHTNFSIALDQRRSLAEGRLLPDEMFNFVRDLVDEPNQAALAKYFDAGAPID
ncbi:MAG: hypothetical protein R3A44_12435 [Caldilineaceae bacterium]